MQRQLPLDLLLRRRDAHHSVLRVALPAVQAREVQHAASQVAQLVLGDRAYVRRVVRRAVVVPVRRREDARAAELDLEVRIPMYGAIQRREEL